MSCTFRIISLLIYSLSVFGTTRTTGFPISNGTGTGRCVNTFPPFCTDEHCYGITIKHIEGTIFRLGCLSSLKINESLDCKTALSLSSYSSTCIDTGSRRVCCCFPAAEQCNSKWKPILNRPHLNSEEAILLIFCVSVMIATFCGLNKILKFATLEWGVMVASSGCDKYTSLEINIGIIKVMIIIALLMSVWYPILPECQDHNEGVFEESYVFIPQLLNSFVVGLLFCVYPLLLGLLDINRLRCMSMRSFICRAAHTFVSMSATFVSVVPLTMFIFSAVDLYRHEVGTTYCKLGKQLHRIGFCILLYIVYVIVAVIQEVMPLFITRNNESLDWTGTVSEKAMLDESFREQLDTAKSNTMAECEDGLRITPRPFVLDCFGEGVLSLENIQPNEWITLRVLISAPRSYTIYPQKVIIPPQRNSTVTVRLRNDLEQTSPREAGLMLQWFSVGTSCPCVDVVRLWQRPFIMPRSRWKFYVLPVFHESEDNSDRQLVEESTSYSRREDQSD